MKLNRNGFGLQVSAAIAIAASMPSLTNAADYTLYDAGSTAHVNVDSDAGMDHWDVGGGNQLQKQWFYYRIGNTTTASTINSISAASLDYYTGNSLGVTYNNGTISLSIEYALNGGGIGSGDADILESIWVQNLTGGNIDLHFFQYSNFDLLGALGDNVSIGFSGSGYDSVTQWEGAFGITETITSPEADRAEANVAFNTENDLMNTIGYNLNNTLSVMNTDATWAFQWDRSLGAGEGLFVFKDKSMSIPQVPEPSTAALIALGLAGLRVLARRKSS